MPELPSGYDAKSKYKLATEETKSLVFGHELRDREIQPGNPWIRFNSWERALSASFGSWPVSPVSRMEDDAVCWYPSVDGIYICGVVFRNPGGTVANQNEYLLVRPGWREGGPLAFSVE